MIRILYSRRMPVKANVHHSFLVQHFIPDEEKSIWMILYGQCVSSGFITWYVCVKTSLCFSFSHSWSHLEATVFVCLLSEWLHSKAGRKGCCYPADCVALPPQFLTTNSESAAWFLCEDALFQFTTRKATRRDACDCKHLNRSSAHTQQQIWCHKPDSPLLKNLGG